MENEKFAGWEGAKADFGIYEALVMRLDALVSRDGLVRAKR